MTKCHEYVHGYMMTSRLGQNMNVTCEKAAVFIIGESVCSRKDELGKVLRGRKNVIEEQKNSKTQLP
jgi:hypothetical protein